MVSVIAVDLMFKDVYNSLVLTYKNYIMIYESP